MRDRIALMTRFIRYFWQHLIRGVLAGREFIGNKWLGRMLKQNIHFYVRIRNNSYSVKVQDKRIHVDNIFCGLKSGGSLAVFKSEACWEHAQYILADCA